MPLSLMIAGTSTTTSSSMPSIALFGTFTWN
jgi:hypothetical protein